MKLLFLFQSPALGTCMNGLSVFEAFKTALPDSEIAVAASGIGYELIRNSPFVDHAWKTASSEQHFFQAFRDLRRRLKRSKFRPDWVLTDSWNQRSKILLLGLAAPFARRGGYAVYPKLIHRSLQFDPGKSILLNNLRLLELFGKEARHMEPRMFFSPTDLEAARALLGGTDRPRAIMNAVPSGSGPTEWLDERMAAVGDHLHRELGFDIFFGGSESQSESIDRIRNLMQSPSISLAGKTTIPTFAAVMALCDLGVGIDSGPMHLARGVNVPYVLIAPYREAAHNWLPIGQPQFAVLRRSDPICKICQQEFCMSAACMAEITVAQAIRAISDLLNRYPPSVQSREARASAGLAP